MTEDVQHIQCANVRTYPPVVRAILFVSETRKYRTTAACKYDLIRCGHRTKCRSLSSRQAPSPTEKRQKLCRMSVDVLSVFCRQVWPTWKPSAPSDLEYRCSNHADPSPTRPHRLRITTVELGGFCQFETEENRPGFGSHLHSTTSANFASRTRGGPAVPN